MQPSSGTTLYRPIGLFELRWVASAAFRAFPPRLPEQPIFYPVLSREYAAQIARDWNTNDERSGFSGFVTSFEVDTRYLQRFEVQVVGSSEHRELWVPAEELPTFNSHILGTIQILESFYGSAFAEEIDADTNLPKEIVRAVKIDPEDTIQS